MASLLKAFVTGDGLAAAWLEPKKGPRTVEMDRRGAAIERLEAQLAAAEAKAARLETALTLYREAVKIDVKMEGPRFMGVNSSALKRAWEADRAALEAEP